MATPTPVFPAALATSAQLKVANNLIATTLRVGVDAVNTVLFVTSAAGFLPNTLVSIDKEIIAIDSVVTAPNPALVVATGGRGFDGTSAAAHSANARVAMLIDAWHHNALAAEVQAIEAFIGPNGQNIGGAAYWIFSKPYDFPAQTPGGSLVAGNNSILLSPVPKGVNGSDQFHYLYISGGTGAAEAVLITGGTAVSGAASGSMIVNCANTHTGAWTIQSASAGIQEAINILPSGAGTVIIPVGDHTVRGTVTVPGSNTAITGLHGASVTDNTAAGMNLFRFFRPGGLVGGRNAIRDLYITCLKSSDSCIYIDGQNTMLVRDIYIQGGSPTGITIAANAGTFDVYIENVNVSLANATAGKGIAILGSGSTKPSGVYISKTQLASGQYGLYLTGVGGLYVSQTDIIVPTTGIMIAPGTGSEVSLAWFSDVTVDTCGDNGIQTSPTGSGSVSSLQFIGCWTATCTGVGVQINAGGSTVVDGIRFIGHRSVNNQKHGVQLTGGINVQLSDCTIAGNSTGSIGVFHGLAVGTGVSKFQVVGGTYGPADKFIDAQAFGIFIAAGASNSYQITNANVSGNTLGTINDQGTGINKIIKNNIGDDDAGFPTIASAASISLGTTDQPGYFISGGTPITTIQGGWRGREITLIFTGAPPGGLGTGGNINRAQTAVQYQAIRLTFDGTGWF
jgi:hypothetical protein